MGTSVDAFVGRSWAVLEGLQAGQINPRVRSRGPNRGATRGSDFAFACSMRRPSLLTLFAQFMRAAKKRHFFFGFACAFGIEKWWGFLVNFSGLLSAPKSHNRNC